LFVEAQLRDTISVLLYGATRSEKQNLKLAFTNIERAARVRRVNINWSVDTRCVVNRGHRLPSSDVFTIPFA